MVKRFQDILKEQMKHGDDVTIDDIKGIMAAVWKIYPHLSMVTENNMFVLKIKDGTEIYQTTASQMGLANIFSYVSAIRMGMMMSGKDVPYYPQGKRKITKEDPYGEEDWEN
jgi:hypothetical protein